MLGFKASEPLLKPSVRGFKDITTVDDKLASQIEILARLESLTSKKKVPPTKDEIISNSYHYEVSAKLASKQFEKLFPQFEFVVRKSTHQGHFIRVRKLMKQVF